MAGGAVAPAEGLGAGEAATGICDLVVSALKGRIVLGQRVYFQDDTDKQQSAFLSNAPSLSVVDARRLRGLLDKAIQKLDPNGDLNE